MGVQSNRFQREKRENLIYFLSLQILASHSLGPDRFPMEFNCYVSLLVCYCYVGVMSNALETQGYLMG